MLLTKNTTFNLLDYWYHGKGSNFVILTDKPHWSNEYADFRKPSQYFSYTYTYTKALIDNHYNWYTTLNLCHGRRLLKNLSVIIGFMADLDTQKAGIHHFKLDSLINWLPLKPTYVVDSGHGYHLLWLINPFFLSSNPKKNTMTKNNYKKIEKWIGFWCNYWSYINYHKECFDYKCTDPLHEIRIVGSWNVKDPRNPKLCKIIRYSRSYYTFQLMLIKMTDYHTSANRKLFLKKHPNYNNKRYLFLCRLHNDLNRVIYARKHSKTNKHPKHINAHLTRQENSSIKAINGLITHIMRPSYKLYGHRDLAQYFYLCLLNQKEPDLSIKQLISRHHWFLNKVVKPKLESEHKTLPTSYIHKIDNEIIHHHPWPYIANYNYICSEMGFNGKLWTTNKAKHNYVRHNKKNRDKKIYKLHRYNHYSIRKISKIVKLNPSTISRILKH